jgi:hypothetical protein
MSQNCDSQYYAFVSVTTALQYQTISQFSMQWEKNQISGA